MKTCAMHIGRLVSHPCGTRASGMCRACGRAMCEKHWDASAQQCLMCLGRYAPPAAPLTVSESEMLSFDEAELAAFDGPGSQAIEEYQDS